MNSLLAPTSTEAIEQIKHAEEVTRILRQNVVQGERVSGKESQERYRMLRRSDGYFSHDTDAKVL